VKLVPGEAILVVDDNETNVKLVRFLLVKRGYDVRVAANANEALAVLESFVPHLILMDLQLPGMDGLELTRRIKAEPRTRAVPIVAVTAYAMKGDEEKARQAGCDGYITKPIDTHALPSKVAEYLSRSGSEA
jgi:CheY-like chemotaxis protein